MNGKKECEGFTLIELLVVIAIIAILSTIVMSSMDGARKKAKDTSFYSTSKSIQASVLMCCETTGTTLKPSSGSTQPAVGGDICYDDEDYSALSNSGKYPGANSIGFINVTDDCDSGKFTIVLTPGTDNFGTYASLTCNQDSCWP